MPRIVGDLGPRPLFREKIAVSRTLRFATLAAVSVLLIVGGPAWTTLSDGRLPFGVATASAAPSGAHWASIPTTGSAPAAGPMVYDASDGYVLLFAGCAPQGPTWAYSHGTWSSVPTNPGPTVGSAALAYDAHAGYVVLFGGVDCRTLAFLPDTWTFHAGVWTNVSSAIAPPPREAAELTYDVTDQAVLLFGGYGPRPGGGYERLNDTWEFSEGAWHEITPALSPSARNLYAIASDEAGGETVLFGGAAEYGPPSSAQCCSTLNDTWSFQGGTWRNVTSAIAPSAQLSPGMTYDPQLPAVVLVEAAGTWTFHGGAWQEITTDVPAVSGALLLVFDGADSSLLLFGSLPHGPVNSTWEFVPGSPGPSEGIPTWVWIVVGAAGAAAAVGVGYFVYSARRRH